MSAQTYSGGCQCGAVRYEATGIDTDKAIACNCSRCGRMGFMLCFVPAGSFDLKVGAEALTEFRFNKHVIQHLFCNTCGVQSFGRGKGPDGNDMVAVNIRTLDGIDANTLKPAPYDGLHA